MLDHPSATTSGPTGDFELFSIHGASREMEDFLARRFQSAAASTPWLRQFLFELAAPEPADDPNRDIVVTLKN